MEQVDGPGPWPPPQPSAGGTGFGPEGHAGLLFSGRSPGARAGRPRMARGGRRQRGLALGLHAPGAREPHGGHAPRAARRRAAPRLSRAPPGARQLRDPRRGLCGRRRGFLGARDARGLGLQDAHGRRLLRDRGCVHSSIQEVRAVKCPLLTDDALQTLNRHHATTLRRVDFSYCRLLTSDGIETLVRDASQLEAIALKGCPKVGDTAIVAVASHCGDALRALQLGGSGNVSDVALEALAQHCAMLQALDIARSNPFGMGRGGVSDGALMHLLAKCRRVETLVLRGQGRLTANVLAFMSFNCLALQSLDIGGCRGIVQNTTLLCGALKRMARLEQLSVSFCGGVVDDEHVSSIVSECPQLKKFDVDGEAIVAPVH
ncbi:hypothetical protein PINS_up007742 [Pythium insidiosum]|nr:hypothetical protein PINS_up007742 [Pythium insidiosum]